MVVAALQMETLHREVAVGSMVEVVLAEPERASWQSTRQEEEQALVVDS